MEYIESSKYYSDDDSDQDLWLLLTHTRYAVFRAREKELQRYGVSPEQVGLLFVVQALGPKATPAAISRHIIRQPHTVSALVDRMAKRGLVKKVKDLDRKNLVRVVMTEKGKKLLTDMSLKAFMDETASESPAPGGGSVSSYIGALGAALGTMVANLSAHKRGWDDRWEEFSAWAEKGKDIQNKLLFLVEEDLCSECVIQRGLRFEQGCAARLREAEQVRERKSPASQPWQALGRG